MVDKIKKNLNEYFYIHLKMKCIFYYPLLNINHWSCYYYNYYSYGYYNLFAFTR